jgi:hypothetical protein
MILKAIIIWFLLAVVAVANGTARNTWITPHLGEEQAHVISTLTLCLLIIFVTIASIGWIGPRNLRQATLVGLLWVVTTLAFEFLAGHYTFGHSWQKLFADYKIWQGRLWILVPIVTCLAPRWAWRLRGM